MGDTDRLARFMNYGGAMVPDPEGQWVRVGDVMGVRTWNLDPLAPTPTDTCPWCGETPCQCDPPENRVAPGQPIPVATGSQPSDTAPTPPDAPAPHPGENHDYHMTCLRCGEPGYLFVGFHSPGETFNWSEAQPKETDRE